MLKYLRTYSIFLQSLFILPLAEAQASQWDWTPKESLTAEQQTQLGQYCQGSYINGWQATNTQNTNLAADLIVRDADGVIYLEGAAEIIQPTSTLSADKIKGIPDGYYQANGNVTLRSEDLLIRSSSSYISGKGNTSSKFTNAQFLNHDTSSRIEAESLTYDQNGVIFIEEGFFTTCEPNEESWKLYGSSIELDQHRGFGTAKHVQIHIAGIPVFYFPWLRFPIDERRHTGLLFPNVSYSSSNGLGISAPFYWNIAPNYDATITPNYLQEKGAGIDLEFRHLSSYGETVYEQSTFDDVDEGEQTLLKLTSDQKLNPYFSAGLTIEANLTEEKYPEANTTSIGEEDNYERSAYVSFNNGNFLNKLTYLTYQTPGDSEDQPFEWLPRLSSSYDIASTHFEYDIEAQYTDFYDPDEDDFDGQRTVINQDLQLNFENTWGSISPGILGQFRDYTTHDYTTNSDSTTSISHITGYIDSSLDFERRLILNNNTWKQTLTPRLSYLNAPFKDQDEIEDFDASDPTLTYSQAFSHTRFDGNDRIGDTEQVTFGLESRLYDEKNNEKWTVKVGQVFYLKDRYVDISGGTDESTAIDDSEQSDLLTSASYNGDRYSLTSNLNYDLNEDEVSLAQIIAKLEPVDDVKIHLSYLYSINNTDSDDDTDEASIGTVFPLNQNWSFYSQYTYDFLDKQATKQVSGLGYENCCMKVSLSYQDWLDDDDEFNRGVFLQFTLRSLSTVGSANSETSIADTYWNQGKVGY
jgi:LPS-assembly protein